MNRAKDIIDYIEALAAKIGNCETMDEHYYQAEAVLMNVLWSSAFFRVHQRPRQLRVRDGKMDEISTWLTRP